MTVTHRLPPFCAFQTLIFLEHSAENYVPCHVVTFCSDPCPLELTQLRDWGILPSTTACHINLETFIVRLPGAEHEGRNENRACAEDVAYGYLQFCVCAER